MFGLEYVSVVQSIIDLECPPSAEEIARRRKAYEDAEPERRHREIMDKLEELRWQRIIHGY